ncbi:MAG: 16S rRNA (guanine(527)-N(7))-methyltransferase RsmG [Clostridia bacterium]|nr:16S rRNA (guanine(527)-N(7))-methyltransferase RsmG [Clostridia bacterium]
MKKLFEKFNYSITEKQAEKFEKYYNLLIFYNKKFNITAITEKEEVVKKHFIDSLSAVNNVNKGKVIDVGAGGGFPSIPLKIINDDINLTLLEATGKKCEFLKAVIKELELNNANVINARAEDLAKDEKYRESFDFAVSRAVARLNTLCEYCLPFVKLNGQFIAYKADAEEEIKEAENAIKILGGEIFNIDNFELFDAKRTIVYVNKVKHTDKKYPRGNGKERKNPL